VKREPVAWVLNLDAENELETRGTYTTPTGLQRIVARQAQRLLGELVLSGDVVLDGDAPDERARGLAGFAWSPTARAVERLESAGARPVAAPDPGVLRRVNARPFTVDVRTPLAGASFAKSVARTLDEALALVARPAADGWLVRRSFGAAGRGRRRIAAGTPDEAERAWLVASLRLGPLVVEPWVHVTREFTRSGWVAPDGEVVVAPPCFQETTAEGAWTRTDAAGRGEVAHDDDARLEQATVAAGDALARAGYFGPFGIDAFRYRVSCRSKGEVLNPLSEINARFTMDWLTGMTARDGAGILDAWAQSSASADSTRARSFW